MNKPRLPFLFACWLTLTLALLPVLRAEETPPAAPAPAAETAAPVAEKSAEAAPTDDKAVTPSDDEKPAGELRELGAEESRPATKKKSSRRTRGVHGSGDQPPHFGGDQTISADKTRSEAVTIFGNTTVDGHLTDAAVSVFGNTTVNGTVDQAAVSVFGTTTVNGKVGDAAVAVFGDLVLGPKAEIGGETVVVFGKLIRSPGAQTHGGVQEVGSFGPFRNLGGGLRAWFNSCLLMARPLWIGENLGWAWIVAACFLVFYLLLALLFPTGIEKCVEVLEQKPGGTFLAALLAMMLTPIITILLAITGVGILLIPFLIVGLIFGTLFGKAAVLGWLGRRVTRLFGSDGVMGSVFVAVLIGSLITWGLYMVPVLGFLLFKFFGILGLGMVVYRLVLSMKRDKPPVAAAVPPPVPAMAAGFADNPPPVAGPEGAAVPAAAPVATPVSADTLPRAGFWLRVAASALDAILIGMLCGFLGTMWHGFAVFPFWFAVYCAAMWANKGTTIGGIICGLKVVRLDDRPLDWTVAVVRALGAFLSLAVAGLGFIWVAFDDEKQSWHDKIAGTTIVRVPKGTALL
ncbi:MAG: RDD family protein [Opitutae bacterium]|nr:RDD family protein [Opitutae bacterium]